MPRSPSTTEASLSPGRSSPDDELERLRRRVAELEEAAAGDVGQALRESEARYRTLVEHAPEAVVVFDLDTGRFVDCNDNAVRLYGLPRERLLQVGPAEMSPPEQPDGRPSAEAAHGLIQLALSGEVPSFEWIHRDAAGVDIPCEVRLVRLPATGRRLIRGSVTDISGRKRAAARLRKSEELLRRVIEAMPGGVVRISSDGAVLDANVEAQRVLGLSFDALTKRYLTSWEGTTIYEDGSPCPVEDYPAARCLQTGEPQRQVTIGVKRPDGEISWAVFTALPLPDPNTGLPDGAIVTFLDITERKREQDERRQLEAQVRRTQKLESLGVLAGGIAHDFNNLLMAIRGNAELALLALTRESEACARVDDILKASFRAAELTDQMLTYAGQTRSEFRAIDLNVRIEELRPLLQAASAKKATIRYELAADLPAVKGDSAQLGQVIMNLITNAAEAVAAGEGGVTVTTELRRADCRDPETCFFSELGDEPCVALVVADTGPGMDADTRRRIFDPFFTTKFTGRGLGLASVLGIVKGHRAAICVDSEPGRGTTVTVLLPMADVAPEPESKGRSDSSPRGTGTVLVVDDDDNVRQLIANALEMWGFDVIQAADGRQGVAAFAAAGDRVRAVILDQTMPVMTGDAAFAEMQRLRPEVPVILISGHSSEHAVAGFAGRGPAAFLHKPFSPTELLATLRELLDGAD